MSAMFKDAPAVLARHGIAPDADAGTLLAELEARGWEATVEESVIGRPGPTGFAPRFRVLAIRTRVEDAAGQGALHHKRAFGRTAEAALARVLAAVLEHQG